jgi:hypothetical protein
VNSRTQQATDSGSAHSEGSLCRDQLIWIARWMTARRAMVSPSLQLILTQRRWNQFCALGYSDTSRGWISRLEMERRIRLSNSKLQGHLFKSWQRFTSALNIKVTTCPAQTTPTSSPRGITTHKTTIHTTVFFLVFQEPTPSKFCIHCLVPSP